MELTREGLYRILRKPAAIKRYYRIAIASYFGLTENQLLDPQIKPGAISSELTTSQLEEWKDKRINDMEELIALLRSDRDRLSEELQNLKKTYTGKKSA